MTILFFDTETTGLLDFKADLMEPYQPRICQLAAILTEDDGTHIQQLSSIIKPEGWDKIDPGAFEAHGITIERCHAEGRPMKDVLLEFNEMKEKSTARAGYNLPYDKRMLAREANLHGIPHDSDGIESHCVMKMATPIVNMAPTMKMLRAGFNKPKSPKLSEAYRHFFGCDFDGAHDAMSDVIATIAIYFKIRELQKEAA